MISDPLCEMCLRKGITRPATDVHHIQSFMSTKDMEARKVLAFDPTNLMSLCDECHNEIHHGKRRADPPPPLFHGGRS